MSTEKLPIVVALDGSPEAGAALDWALLEAQSRTTSLRLVCSLDPYKSFLARQTDGPMSVSRQQQAQTVAATMLATAAEHAATVAPEVTVTTHLYHDDNDAAKVLLGESARASTIVLGSRRRGALGSAVMGSVGTAVSAGASCPVVVLRGPAGMIEEDPRVVVGVDGRESSKEALAFAFDFASRRALPLRAVLCWHRDLFAEMLWRPEPPAPARVEAWLSEAIASWQQRYPDVSVAATVVRDHPVDGLLAAAAAQYLLVVGNRGQHALTGTLFGSVTQGVLFNATCPVAVVPTAS